MTFKQHGHSDSRRRSPAPSRRCRLRSRSRKWIPSVQKVTRAGATMNPTCSCRCYGRPPRPPVSFTPNNGRFLIGFFWAVLPAFLLEVTLYYALGNERWRARTERWPPSLLTSFLALSGVAPYLAATLDLHSFETTSLLAIGRSAPGRILLVRDASALRCHRHFFPDLHGRGDGGKGVSPSDPNPNPRLPLELLGQLMWIRTGAFALLSIRKVKGVGFGFVPRAVDWKIGAIAYAIFVPVAVMLAWAIVLASACACWNLAARIPLCGGDIPGHAVGHRAGEEFFFLGLLQQWLVQWARSEWVWESRWPRRPSERSTCGSVPFQIGDSQCWPQSPVHFMGSRSARRKAFEPPWSRTPWWSPPGDCFFSSRAARRPAAPESTPGARSRGEQAVAGDDERLLDGVLTRFNRVRNDVGEDHPGRSGGNTNRYFAQPD